MILSHEQLPNICDGCGKIKTLIHFHTKTDEWIALCRDCQAEVTSIVFLTSKEERLAKIITQLRCKNG